MKIVILANFPSLLNGKPNGRFTYLAKMLYEKGHEIEFIVSDFEHGPKKHRKITEGLYPYKVTYLHETGYPDNISLKRLWSHHVWGKNVGKHLKTIGKVDVVYAAVPSLTAAKAAADFCKKTGAKFIVDVQDLWPEAFCMAIHNKVLQKGFLPMKWYVDKVYGAADVAVAVSDTYVNRIFSVNNHLNSGVSVFLGNDGDVFDKGRKEFKIQRNDNELWLCYVGSLSYSYDIPCVIDALAMVNERGNVKQHIKFVVMGGGTLREKFEAHGKEKGVDCEFLGSKPYSEMVGIMCSCDMVINPIVKGSAASIINKVGDYALSGLPVINTQESPEYRALVDEYQCGINCRCENAEDVADAIEKLALNEELRKTMGTNSARLGRDKFDRRNTYQAIVDAVEDCVK